MIDNKRNFAKNTVARKKRLEARRLAVTLSDDAAPSLQLQPIFLDLLTFPNHGGLGIWSRKKFELEITCEHGRIILEKRRPEVRCTVVVSQRPGCLRYLPKILCDNINYSRSRWRCSLFHIYRAHQFSAVSRISRRKFSSKRWTWAVIQRHLKNNPWPEVRCTVVVPQMPGCLRYLAKIWRYCVTTLTIHNHSDDLAYFTFIELTSSVPLAELLVKNFHQSVEHGP